MLVPKRVQTARLTWADRDGRTARTTLYAPSLVSFSSFQAAIFSWINVARVVSNAKLVKVEFVYETVETDMSEPGLGSDCTVFLALYYGKEAATGVEALYIPSPVGEIFDPAGKYAGIRAQAETLQLQAFNEALESSPAQLLTVDGTPWPTSFIVGGLVV